MARLRCGCTLCSLLLCALGRCRVLHLRLLRESKFRLCLRIATGEIIRRRKKIIYMVIGLRHLLVRGEIGRNPRPKTQDSSHALQVRSDDKEYSTPHVFYPERPFSSACVIIILALMACGISHRTSCVAGAEFVVIRSWYRIEVASL